MDSSIAQSKGNYKYHIVFEPKYIRQTIDEKNADIEFKKVLENL